jgi:hypothetical protein
LPLSPPFGSLYPAAPVTFSPVGVCSAEPEAVMMFPPRRLPSSAL